MVQVTMPPVLVASTAAAYAYARCYDTAPIATVAAAWAIAIPLYVVAWRSYIYPFYVSPLRHIPTVEGFPLWGQFREVVSEECGVPQRRWHKKYGPIVRYFFPFGSERLIVADNDALKHMTVRNPYNYPKPVRAKLWMARILGDNGILLAEGPEHVHQRKALAPGFSIQSIRALTPVFWERALRLASCWREEMSAEGATTKTFEVLEWLNRTTLDIIGKAGFGYDIDSLDHPEAPIREAYRLVFAFDLTSRLLHGLQAFIPASKYIPAKMNRDMETSRGIIVDKSNEIITQKQEEAENNLGGKDIISLIVKDNKKLLESGQPGLSFETIRDQIMTFLGAGHDTTATGVTWTLHLLATHPEMQSRLREEIKDYLPFLFDERRHDPESYADADPDQLPFMDNICRESLRYIPPIPMTVRQSIADDTLAGYHIPAGTVLYVISNAINRLPTYWGPTADQFDPDRWDNLPETFTNNAFMTFLQGPRSCIGRKFAETEMKIMLCCLLSMYEFNPDTTQPNPEDWKMWRLVLRPKWGVSLNVTAL